MKITAGFSSVDDYPACVHAGADELFCGYVPDIWNQRYGIDAPLNRRQVRCYNVQIGGRNELLLLRSFIDQYQVPVTLTFNAPFYLPEQYPLIGDIILQCLEDGFSSFIIADPALLVWLHRQGMSEKLHLHISGEMHCTNHAMAEWAAFLGAERIIFPRRMALDDIALCINHCSSPLHFEAFMLNEMCHFNGAFCSTLHCDEFAHMCLVPYQLDSGAYTPASPVSASTDPQLPGASGCGLCALWRLHDAGVTHLKIVGRGNYSDNILRDIRTLHKALLLLESAPDENTFLTSIRKTLFPNGCAHQCYYPLQKS